MRAQFPTAQDVAKADHVTVARWYRFLPSPRNTEEAEVMDLLIARLADLGGMTPEVSKKIGWGR
jgi:hypothetical protein